MMPTTLSAPAKRPGMFACSGPALLKDLQSPEWQALFDQLEQVQQHFLSLESSFRSREYRWPSDALHNWSRMWEYPFAYHHLRAWNVDRVASRRPLVADVGSGVTFMPFAVADLGYDVICCDIDPVVGTDLPRAAAALGTSPDSVVFRQCHGRGLPFEDESLDAVYCISVLEHADDPCQVVQEIARVLRPDGLFVLTVDLALRGGHNQLTAAAHARLTATLQQHFCYRAPQRSAHPGGLLTTQNSPIPFVRARLTPGQAAERLAAQLRGQGGRLGSTARWAARRLLARRPRWLGGTDRRVLVAVEGFAFTRAPVPIARVAA